MKRKPTDPYPCDSESAQLDNIVDRLQAMRHLQHNWDSYGAASPSPYAIDRAVVFAKEFLSGDLHICPNANGHIVFESKGGTVIRVGCLPDDDSIWIDTDA